MDKFMSKIGVKPLSVVAGALALAAWLVSHKQQEQQIDEAVQRWFDRHQDPEDSDAENI